MTLTVEDLSYLGALIRGLNGAMTAVGHSNGDPIGLGGQLDVYRNGTRLGLLVYDPDSMDFFLEVTP